VTLVYRYMSLGFFVKGTGKFKGIQAEGTYKSYILGTGQGYSDGVGEYTLP
jgi:hypothetical protein